jgi:hypothetical protein
MDIKCTFSGLTLQENSFVYACLVVSNKSETRPITLPFLAKLTHSGIIEIKDDSTLKYIEDMYNTGEFSHKFNTINVYNPFSGDGNPYTVKTNNPYDDFIAARAEGFKEETYNSNIDLEIGVSVISKITYDKLVEDLKIVECPGFDDSYYEQSNFFCKEYFDNIKKVIQLTNLVDIPSNYFSNPKLFSSITDSYEKEYFDKLSNPSYKSTTEDKLLMNSSLLSYLITLPLGDLVEKTTTIELNADIHNYACNRFISNDYKKTEEEVVSFFTIAQAFMLLDKEFKINSYVVDYSDNAVLKSFTKIITNIID